MCEFLSTLSFAKHKATDELYNSLQTSVDKFVEVAVGRFGIDSIHIAPITEFVDQKSFETYLKKSVAYLEKLDLKKACDLATIRDDIVESLNQTLYLLRLN